MRYLILVLFLAATVASGAGCGDGKRSEVPEKINKSFKGRLPKQPKK